MSNVVSSPAANSQPQAVVIETQDLGKAYRTGFWLNQRITSLQHCSLTIYQGETFGLLGPNGAGKTTLLKTLLGIIRPTTGQAQLFGHPLGDQAVKRRLGYLPENPYFYDFLTGWEFLQYTAGLFGLSAAARQRRIVELLDLVGLSQEAAKKKQLRQYSKGMLQRIGIAQALVNDPDLVFLDEPMSGLDPTGRFQVREIILALKREGKTIFFNSHILSDVEVICDRIAILDQGNLVCVGHLSDLLGTADQYQVKGRGGQFSQLDPWLDNLEVQGNLWHGHLSGNPYPFVQQLAQMGAELISLQQARPSLEEFFMAQIHQRRKQASSSHSPQP
ncbi:multidrug ABC transporter ATP-binding protein [Leptolyngbya sp. BL0902]|uniref:ABC transporter ATP-binding protein n=1 Tax=Leptolyngbya sp. BL0902 TaxID=1115757 RepID=UPI0018E87268|nr:ABC transporter ATP-binding protein [Leptolyngbya sp. BL0902]QQE63984.1 multidrug ABC transporter ATP-binding protein [Leptolyngbya sp. BL0902]